MEVMKIVVTGGASFIGSHLVEALVKEGHWVTVIDDLSSGSIENFPDTIENVRFLTWDLRYPSIVNISNELRKVDVVFHLAADHGGRGYVELEQVACSNNFSIDNNILQACILAEVPKVIFASSGCIYPMYMQNDTTKEVFLREEMASVKYYEAGSYFSSTQRTGHGSEAAELEGLIQPDGLYGLAKITMEMSLQAAYKEKDLSSVSCRFFTVYGPRAKENHAIISFIARTLVEQDPFTIWGDGTQIRNWTYVDDIVKGMILAMEHPSLQKGAHALNLGTMEKITVNEAVSTVLEHARERHNWDHKPRFVYEKDKPTGPLNRVADNSKLLGLGGREPLPFTKGVGRTLDWYFSTKDQQYVKENLERLLVARK